MAVWAFADRKLATESNAKTQMSEQEARGLQSSRYLSLISIVLSLPDGRGSMRRTDDGGSATMEAVSLSVAQETEVCYKLRVPRWLREKLLL